MNLSNRKHLSHRISFWSKSLTSSFNLHTLSLSLRSNEFSEYEELQIWHLIKTNLEGRRKGVRRNEFLKSVEEAIDTLENPENSEPSYVFERLLQYIQR